MRAAAEPESAQPDADTVPPGAARPEPAAAPPELDTAPPTSGAPYQVGDAVWVRRRGARCTEPSRRGVVTGTVSSQVVEVDGLPWHVRCLRQRQDGRGVDGAADVDSASDSDRSDGPPLFVSEHVEPESGGLSGEAGASDEGPVPPDLPLRRSARVRRPTRCTCCED